MKKRNGGTRRKEYFILVGNHSAFFCRYLGMLQKIAYPCQERLLFIRWQMTIKPNLLLEDLSHQLVREGSRYWNFLRTVVLKNVNNNHNGKKHEASDNEIGRIIHRTCYISYKVRFFLPIQPRCVCFLGYNKGRCPILTSYLPRPGIGMSLH